jgi:glutathione peroxidase
MWRWLACLGALAMISTASTAAAADNDAAGSAKTLSYTMKDLSGKPLELKQYSGKVVLFVNVASYCGYTKQYDGLQKLHDKYADKGLVVVGVPCNQFGKQEPGTATEIAEFCQKNYGVSFPMLEKVDVNGDGACDLYKHLTSVEAKPKGAGKVSWNFEKFLVGRSGEVVGRFGSAVAPESDELMAAIEKELSAK